MDTQNIKGSTRLIGLLGDPVAHSLSPAIHNHALRKLGLDFAYVPLRVAPQNLTTAVAAMKGFGFLGANVTIPHKQAVMSCCDSISALSRSIGAVNTLSFDGPLLKGTSTDPAGFFRAMAWMGHDAMKGRIVVLGNGGTARTLAMALALEKNPASLTIIGRDEAKVRALAADVQKQTGCVTAGAVFTAPEALTALDTCTLCVNCTSVGMHPAMDVSPLPPQLFHRDMTVFDTIYNPSKTLFLKYAESAGCAAQNGLRMLLFQALESLKIWTGTDVPESMFDISELERALTNH